MPSTHRVLEHRVRAVVALLALALAAFGFSACGDDSGSGGGGGDTAEVETLLTQTFTGTHKIDSGKANLVVRVTTEGDSSIRGPIELKVSGPFQTAGKGELPKFDLALDIHAQGQGFSAGLASTSDKLFVKFGGTAYEVPATLIDQMKKNFDSGSASKSGLSLDSLGIDPMSWLKDPKVAGTETVAGVETEHITSELDVNALLDDIDGLLAKVKDQVPAGATGGQQIPDSIPEDTRKQIEDAVKDATVDIWTGKDDKTLRKLLVTLAVELPESSKGPKSLDISVSFELAELNEPQTIKAPATTRPLSELLGQLQGLLGGALGGGALGGGSGSADSPNIDEYTQCLQDAQGDVQKAQDCAGLLTQ